MDEILIHRLIALLREMTKGYESTHALQREIIDKLAKMDKRLTMIERKVFK